ncbi:MAG: Hsp33 family molecular chaperone HslO [Deltaproteobacteria bacterium]|nr:Hsp33 family molecular chaperone HslO [Deltaproteobacteria bacterium]MBW2291572.1 Hsp33 family molecular chaperone HslO [Deltaproteobacteria bacterium]MBW2723870.1 Hsp33 family molecular chaperone HslO [Deltaproteobacteria bacterium]
MRTISEDGGVAVRTIIGSNLIAEAMNRRTMAPTAANALGRALMGAVLIAVGPASADQSELDHETDPERIHAPDFEDDRQAGESVQLQFRGNGPLGTVMAIADDLGRVRGTVEHPSTDLSLADGSPDVARAIGLGALRVVRHRPEWREPYTGAVPLVSGEIAKDITLYLTESEQTPSAMGLGVAMANDESAVVAAGFLVQILPDAMPEEVDRVEENVRTLPALSQLALSDTNCNELIDLLLRGLGSRERHTAYPVFHCSCSRKRALRTMALLGQPELREMVAGGLSQQVRCEFCAKAYDFPVGDILTLLENRSHRDSD